MATFTLNVNIDDKIYDILKECNYKLCVARKVNNTYTVIWSGEDFLSQNVFAWTEEYQVFGEKTFMEGAFVTAATNPQRIAFGQTCVLQEDGRLLHAIGTPDRSGTFKVRDDYGSIHVAANAKLNGKFAPIFVSSQIVTGTVKISPSNAVSVWFDSMLKTGAMILDAISDAVEVVYDDDVVTQSVIYQQVGDRVGKGVWIVH